MPGERDLADDRGHRGVAPDLVGPTTERRRRTAWPPAGPRRSTGTRAGASAGARASCSSSRSPFIASTRRLATPPQLGILGRARDWRPRPPNPGPSGPAPRPVSAQTQLTPTAGLDELGERAPEGLRRLLRLARSDAADRYGATAFHANEQCEPSASDCSYRPDAESAGRPRRDHHGSFVQLRGASPNSAAFTTAIPAKTTAATVEPQGGHDRQREHVEFERHARRPG